jgi:prepilin-type N-terminal cleavage/methylation domain-containing protein
MKSEGRKERVGKVRSEVKDRSLSLLPFSRPSHFASARGWTLIELVITLTVLSVLTLGIIPLVRTSIRRQKEQQLREALREMRGAIDAFKRDTVGMQCGPLGNANIGGQNGEGGNGNGNGNGNSGPYIDPRSRVVIADCKIFGVDNIDRSPPDLQTLVDGVDVIARPSAGGNGVIAGAGLDGVGGSALQGNSLVPKKKIYLREIPVDPITGERDWCVLSSLEPADQGCSASPPNVFDVRSKSHGEALNGEKYSEW